MNEEDLKSCCTCDIVKQLSGFCFRKAAQEYRNQCSDCNKLIIKEYKTMNKDEIKHYNKNYFQNNKEELYQKIKKRYKTDINL